MSSLLAIISADDDDTSWVGLEGVALIFLVESILG